MEVNREHCELSSTVTMKVLTILGLVLLPAVVQVLAEDEVEDPIVNLPNYGEVRGRTVTLEDEWYKGIETDNFYGIPYGEDTSGENRFMVIVIT